MNDRGSFFASKELLDAISHIEENVGDPLDNVKITIGQEIYQTKILSIMINEFAVELVFNTDKNSSIEILRKSIGKKIKISILPDLGEAVITSSEIRTGYENKLLVSRLNN